MTNKLKLILITVLLAIVSCLGITTAFAKYMTTQPIGDGYFNLNIETNIVPYAVYSADDNSLEFFYGKYPKGDEKSPTNKTPTAVYKNIATTNYNMILDDSDTSTIQSNSVLPEWYTDNNYKYIEKIFFDDSFKDVNPVSTSGWFAQFSAANSFDLTNLNTSTVTNMSAMFWGCSKITSLDVSGLDTNSVTNMSHMFRGCSKLKTLVLKTEDKRNFKTGSVTTMLRMFAGCSVLTALDVSNFNTEKVTSMKHMFAACGKLTELDLSAFHTPEVSTMAYMFSGSTTLANVTMTDFSNEKLTHINQMFNQCTALKSVWLTNFNTSKVKNMYYLFSGCSNLETIYVSDTFVTSSVEDSRGMFINCTHIKGGNGTVYNASHTDKEYARVDGVGGLPGYFTYSGYTLSFDAVEGAGAPSLMLSETNSFTIPNQAPTDNGGRNFVGWSTIKNSYIPQYYVGNTFTIEGTAKKDTLYAVYDNRVTTYEGLMNTRCDQYESGVDAEVVIVGGTWIDDSSNPAIDLADYTYEVNLGGMTITISSPAKKVTIDEGTFEGGLLISGSTDTQYSSTAIINGGIFNVSTFKGDDIDISIYGGKWTADSIVISGEGTHTAKIYGGEFKWNPTQYLAEGYVAVLNESTGYYEVIKSCDTHTISSCTDNGDGTHTGTCSVCGAVINNAHDITSWTISASYHTAEGCSMCSYTGSREAHNFSTEDRTCSGCKLPESPELSNPSTSGVVAPDSSNLVNSNIISSSGMSFYDAQSDVYGEKILDAVSTATGKGDELGLTSNQDQFDNYLRFYAGIKNCSGSDMDLYSKWSQYGDRDINSLEWEIYRVNLAESASGISPFEVPNRDYGLSLMELCAIISVASMDGDKMTFTHTFIYLQATNSTLEIIGATPSSDLVSALKDENTVTFISFFFPEADTSGGAGDKGDV